MRWMGWPRGRGERGVRRIQVSRAIGVTVIIRATPSVIRVVRETPIAPARVLEGTEIAETRWITTDAAGAGNCEPRVWSYAQHLGVAAIFRVVGIRGKIDPENVVGQCQIRHQDPAVQGKFGGDSFLYCGPLLWSRLQHAIDGDREGKCARPILRRCRLAAKVRATRSAERKDNKQGNGERALHGVPLWGAFGVTAGEYRQPTLARQRQGLAA